MVLTLLSEFATHQSVCPLVSWPFKRLESFRMLSHAGGHFGSFLFFAAASVYLRRFTEACYCFLNRQVVTGGTDC